MTRKSAIRSLALVSLLGLGMAAAPNLASARDSAAPIQPVGANTPAGYGGTTPLLSSGGAVVTGNAWCDPITNECLKHPWTTRGHYD